MQTDHTLLRRRLTLELRFDGSLRTDSHAPPPINLRSLRAANTVQRIAQRRALLSAADAVRDATLARLSQYLTTFVKVSRRQR